LENWPAAVFAPDHPWTALRPTSGRPNALLRVSDITA
jgi:hypothetical protein